MKTKEEGTSRDSRPFPKLVVKKYKYITDFKYEDMKMGYHPYQIFRLWLFKKI